MNRKILIVGGVAGGAGAAARLRRLSEEDEIIIFEKTPYISYANCGLPYYIGQTIKERDKLLVQTVEGMSKRFNLDIRVNNEVVTIDRGKKTVQVKDLRNNTTYEESYDTLILSPGAEALMPPIENIDKLDNLFTLKTIPDTDKIYNYIIDKEVKKAVVVGGGFIGVETAENLKERGIDVTLIDFAQQVMAGPSDFEMAQFLHDELATNGIKLILGDLVAAFSEDGKTVTTKNGIKIETDMIIMSAGIKPASDLAIQSGLEIDKKTQAIVVDEYFKTSDEDIYAVGDVIMQKDNILGRDKLVPLAWGANRQARQIADSIHGRPITKDDIKGASVIKVFNKTFASVGITERLAKSEGLKYEVIYVNRNNHAGYYPDATPIVLKLIFNKDSGEIYGAQAVGSEGVEKRIDVISTAMKFGAKVTDLSSIEVCYAPPYNSAKDPVNIAGYVAENVMEGVYQVVQYHQIDEIVAKGGYLIDVRTPDEYGLAHIKGSTNIELDAIRNSKEKLPKDKETPIYVTCQVGHRAYLAIQILSKYGYKNLYNLTGGFGIYNRANQTFKAIDNNPPKETKKKPTKDQIDKELDCSGLQCPGPIMQTKKHIDAMNEGEVLKIYATDTGFARDIESWCQKTGNTAIGIGIKNGKVEAVIAKGTDIDTDLKEHQPPAGKATTLVVFSGELDKVMAAMIIANGSAALNHKVTMFFTFWGLNALRKDENVKIKKSFLDKMFGTMMPKGVNKLKLSNMNMLGMGSQMMKYTMKQKNVDTLEDLVKQAIENGVEIVACTMSMDVMGIKEEELIDGISFGGVATYVGEAQESQNTLFI